MPSMRPELRLPEKPQLPRSPHAHSERAQPLLPALIPPCATIHLLDTKVPPSPSEVTMNKHTDRPTLTISAARPSLPTSSSDFALPSSPSASLHQSASDDLTPFLLRLRRPSLLGPRNSNGSLSDRLHSPLVSSFTRRYSSGALGEDSESDKDKMSTDSDSGHATPLLSGPTIDTESDTSMKTSRPHTPPRMTSASSSSSGNEDQPSTRAHNRRPSHPVRPLPSFPDSPPCPSAHLTFCSSVRADAPPHAGPGPTHPRARVRVAHAGQRAQVGGTVPAHAGLVQRLARAPAHAPCAI